MFKNSERLMRKIIGQFLKQPVSDTRCTMRKGTTNKCSIRSRLECKMFTGFEYMRSLYWSIKLTVSHQSPQLHKLCKQIKTCSGNKNYVSVVKVKSGLYQAPYTVSAASNVTYANYKKLACGSLRPLAAQALHGSHIANCLPSQQCWYQETDPGVTSLVSRACPPGLSDSWNMQPEARG